jgi:CelD/BcsL family acetyltransferase involved in cellulose biosynthesis
MNVVPGRTVSVVNDPAGLAALWPAWEGLWRRAVGAWPFSAPAWLRPWWEEFGTGRPVVAILHGPVGLAGLLPLYRLGDKLLPMGVGVSDAFDVLLAPQMPPDAASMLLASALAASDAPRCDLPDLPQGARLLDATTPVGWRSATCDGPPCPVLPLIPEPAIPRGMRRDLRQAAHRAARAGGWRVEAADPASLPALLEALVALHGARWHGRGEPGVLADARVLAFHRAAAPGLLAAGLLRLQAVLLRGRIAAVVHALLSAEGICFYLGGFDPACAFESPGTLLLGHMIEEAAREGRREAHFLRGGEAYKYAWGAVERRNGALSLIRA